MKTAALFLTALFFAVACGANDDRDTAPIDPPATNVSLKFLALGDSYTIGQSVCETCRFPEQLKTRLETTTGRDIELSVIATTGWTTSDLLTGIDDRNPSDNQDLVTLLIGVNNQYQHLPFSVYETEFPQLLQRAVNLAKGDKTRVIVISIPDYAYTPYGQSTSNPPQISTEIDRYNGFAKQHTERVGVMFVNVTDITRRGLNEPGLVASDGLHPSAQAYAEFVSRLLQPAAAIVTR